MSDEMGPLAGYEFVVDWLIASDTIHMRLVRNMGVVTLWVKVSGAWRIVLRKRFLEDIDAVAFTNTILDARFY